MGEARSADTQAPVLLQVRSPNGNLVDAFATIAEAAERIERAGADVVAVEFTIPRDRSAVGRFLVRALALQGELRGTQVLFLN
jgi:hypothetical protein